MNTPSGVFAQSSVGIVNLTDAAESPIGTFAVYPPAQFSGPKQLYLIVTGDATLTGTPGLETMKAKMSVVVIALNDNIPNFMIAAL